MSMSNRVILLGRLGRDPETKIVGDTTICNITVATDEVYKDKSGERKKETEWHRCAAFGKPAEMIAKYFARGDAIQIEGRLKTRSWDKDGVKQCSTEIVVEQFGFVPGAAKREHGATNHTNTPARATTAFRDDDDIPF